MAIKYLARVAGVITSLSAAVVGGAGSASTLVATNANGLLDSSFFPASIGQDIVVVPTSEAIAAGGLVNIYANAGAANARNADSATAAAGKRTDGFVIAAAASGSNASVYRSGMNTGLAALSPGADYYMGAGGAVTATVPPETAGTTAQRVGKAISAGVLDIQIEPPVAIAA